MTVPSLRSAALILLHGERLLGKAVIALLQDCRAATNRPNLARRLKEPFYFAHRLCVPGIWQGHSGDYLLCCDIWDFSKKDLRA